MLINDPTNPTEPEVSDLASEWGAVLDNTAKEDPTVSVAGSQRRASSSGAPLEAPKVKTKDVEPLVRGLGAVACRAARVSDLSADEARDIAEPAAALLNILAPNLPPWSIPLGTLAARIGAAAEARRDEFQRNRASAGDVAEGEATAPKLVGPDAF